jgi:hypothetical protein
MRSFAEAASANDPVFVSSRSCSLTSHAAWSVPVGSLVLKTVPSLACRRRHGKGEANNTEDCAHQTHGTRVLQPAITSRHSPDQRGPDGDKTHPGVPFATYYEQLLRTQPASLGVIFRLWTLPLVSAVGRRLGKK